MFLRIAAASPKFRRNLKRSPQLHSVTRSLKETLVLGVPMADARTMCYFATTAPMTTFGVSEYRPLVEQCSE